MRRALTSITAAAAVAVGLSVALVAPASAAELPTTDGLYVLSCDNTPNPLGVFSVDPTDATATAVGDGTPSDGGCFYNAAFDASTGITYAIVSTSEGYALVTVDMTTGVSSPIAPFTIDGADTYVDSMAIGGDGSAYAWVDEELFSLDLATGALSLLHEFELGNYFYGFSWDPVVGDFVGIFDDGRIYAIDPAALTVELIGDVGLDSYSTWGVQVDSAGLIWVLGVPFSTDTAYLWTVSRADVTTPTEVGQVLIGGEGEFYSFVVTLTRAVSPAPALAATGVDATAPLTAGALLLVLGAGLLLFRRRAAKA